MEIIVNGDKMVLSMETPWIPDVLRAVGIDPELSGIAVAVNMEVVSRGAWGDLVLQDGDAVEVITARQGG